MATTPMPGMMGPTSGNAQFNPQMMRHWQNGSNGSTPPAPPITPQQQATPNQPGGQQDYSGGNKYLAGLNYTTRQPQTQQMQPQVMHGPAAGAGGSGPRPVPVGAVASSAPAAPTASLGAVSQSDGSTPQAAAPSSSNPEGGFDQGAQKGQMGPQVAPQTAPAGTGTPYTGYTAQGTFGANATGPNGAPTPIANNPYQGQPTAQLQQLLQQQMNIPWDPNNPQAMAARNGAVQQLTSALGMGNAAYPGDQNQAAAQYEQTLLAAGISPGTPQWTQALAQNGAALDANQPIPAYGTGANGGAGTQAGGAVVTPGGSVTTQPGIPGGTFQAQVLRSGGQALTQAGSSPSTGGVLQAQNSGPSYQPNATAPSQNANGIPNSYAGGYFQNVPAYNATPGAYQFAGNNGTGSPYPVTAPPAGSGIAVQPTLSPGLTGSYYQYLQNGADNLAAGVGATPYGQQNVYLPSAGTTAQEGLTAPINSVLAGSTLGIQQAAGAAMGVLQGSNPTALGQNYQPAQNQVNAGIGTLQNATNAAELGYINPQTAAAAYSPLLSQANAFAQYGGQGTPGTQLSSQAQYGAQGNAQDPNGLYTGAQTLQSLASGSGPLGSSGNYLNSATNTGAFGTPGSLQTSLASSGQLAGQGNQTLNSMATNGAPVDQTPAWQAMVASENQNTQLQEAQIAEHAAQTGNLAGAANGGGSGYNQALAMFNQQNTLNQNAQLTQAQTTAQENAANRQLSAAGTLQGAQTGAINSLQAAQQNAGLYGASAQQQAAGTQQGLMQNALGLQNSNQQYGLSTGLSGTSMQQQNAANLSNQSVNTMLNAGNAQTNAGLTGANVTSQQIQNPYAAYSAALTGAQNGLAQNAAVGNNYQNMDQAAITANYNEFLRTQPEYSPLLAAIGTGANTFPGLITPNATSGIGAQVGQIAGGLAAGLGALCWIAAELFGGWTEPRTVLVRRWLLDCFQFTMFGRPLVALYWKYGERIAAHIKTHRVARWFFKKLFDRALLKARIFYA